MKALDNRKARLAALVALVYLAVPRPSYAYLDPGSASYTLQMLIALAVSAAFVVKAYWAKLKQLITGGTSQAKEKGGAPDDVNLSKDAPPPGKAS